MDFTRVTLPDQPYLYVERDCPFSEIGPAMGQAFREIFDFIAQHGIPPLGAPIAVYKRMPSDGKVEFECGVMVTPGDLEKAEGLIYGGTLPAGDAMRALYTGPYSHLSEAHKAMARHMADNGLTMSMPIWEIYLDDPQRTDEKELRTEIYRSIG